MVDGLYMIDRLEGDVAVLEDSGANLHDVPISELPEGAAKGDCITLENGRWSIDAGETQRRAARIADKMRMLTGGGASSD